MSRKGHPAALTALEDAGWTVKEAKGRSAHAWGFVLVRRTRCLPFRYFLPDVGLEYATQSPAHARELLLMGVMKEDGDHD